MGNEDNLRDLEDNMKRSNIRIIGVPEEDRKKDHEKILEPHLAWREEPPGFFRVAAGALDLRWGPHGTALVASG